MPQAQEQRVQSAIKKLTPIALRFMTNLGRTRDAEFTRDAQPIIKRFSKADQTRIIYAAMKAAADRDPEAVDDAVWTRREREAEEWVEQKLEPTLMLNGVQRKRTLNKILNDRQLTKKR